VIQNDALNNVTSVTVTSTRSIGGLNVIAGSNRGDYNIGTGAGGTADFAAGIFIASINQNGRDNSLAPNVGGNTVVNVANQTNTLIRSTAVVEFNATAMFVNVHGAGTTGEGEPATLLAFALVSCTPSAARRYWKSRRSHKKV
jgi:hypothetical protein